jgi:hypothetical protein
MSCDKCFKTTSTTKISLFDFCSDCINHAPVFIKELENILQVYMSLKGIIIPSTDLARPKDDMHQVCFDLFKYVTSNTSRLPSHSVDGVLFEQLVTLFNGKITKSYDHIQKICFAILPTMYMHLNKKEYARKTN